MLMINLVKEIRLFSITIHSIICNKLEEEAQVHNQSLFNQVSIFYQRERGNQNFILSIKNSHLIRLFL